MPARRSESRPTRGDVLVLVGTVKGAFILSSDESRKKWKLDGPHFPGESVYALAYDERGGRCRVLAGVKSNHWGPTIRYSDDFGKTWTAPERQAVRFPEGSGLSLEQVWQIKPGRADEPDRLGGGVEAAGPFEANEGGGERGDGGGLLKQQ